MTKPAKHSARPIPPKIQARLDELNMNISDLAREIDVPRTSLYNVLAAESTPSLALAAKMAWGLGWSLDYFSRQILTDDLLVHLSKSSKLISVGEKNRTFSSAA